MAAARWSAPGAVMQTGGTGGNLSFGSWNLAGKTGTINKNLAVWFSGYTPNPATVVAATRRTRT
ncbi:hypothetical protein E0H73_44990 [Kribbella pittospori]|uniref:Penicillin-binding protein transpeptidase domain-containing protein n=1 Tax=Kribbella pittospori TaxID=722689 RepID=A0A4R0JGQ9_9ACTN|nr:hypothetical protein [Kribbella pittospori]TCC45377.1 hypothetical protein E0H73_44990 [Kribbella pittospori]